jgi:hypothetical protein
MGCNADLHVDSSVSEGILDSILKVLSPCMYTLVPSHEITAKMMLRKNENCRSNLTCPHKYVGRSFVVV